MMIIRKSLLLLALLICSTAAWASVALTQTGNSLAYTPTAIVQGDINNDGREDVLLGSGSAGSWKLEAFSDPVLGSVLWSKTYASVIGKPVVIADGNGDGKKDILVVSSSVFCTLSGFDGSELGCIAISGIGAASLIGVTADFNADGKKDILMGNPSSLYVVSITDAAILLQKNLGGSNVYLMIEDINADAVPEVMACGGGTCSSLDGVSMNPIWSNSYANPTLTTSNTGYYGWSYCGYGTLTITTSVDAVGLTYWADKSADGLRDVSLDVSVKTDEQRADVCGPTHSTIAEYITTEVKRSIVNVTNGAYLEYQRYTGKYVYAPYGLSVADTTYQYQITQAAVDIDSDGASEILSINQTRYDNALGPPPSMGDTSLVSLAGSAINIALLPNTTPPNAQWLYHDKCNVSFLLGSAIYYYGRNYGSGYACPTTVKDLDDDGDSDLLTRSSSTGTWTRYTIQNATITGSATMNAYTSSSVQYVAQLDANGDGDADILTRNTSTGAWYLHQVQNGAVTSTAPIYLYASLDQQFIGAGDFNNDGIDDVMLRSASAGYYTVFLLSNHAVSSTVYYNAWASSSSVPQGIGDFNGDGTDDLLVRRTSDNLYFIFKTTNGAVAASYCACNIWNNPDWTFQFAGDTNKDGIDDIVIRGTGASADGFWWNFRMNNFSSTQTTNLNTFKDKALVSYAANGDYNGDGYTDMLIRVNNGPVYVAKIVNGLVSGSTTLLSNLPSDQVVLK